MSLLLVTDLCVGAILIAIFWWQDLQQVLSGGWALAGVLAAVVYGGSVVLLWRYPRLAAAGAITATAFGWAIGATSDPMIGVAWCLYPLSLVLHVRCRNVSLLLVLVPLLLSMTHGNGSAQVNFGQTVVVAMCAIAGSWLLGQTEARRMQAVREGARREAAYKRVSDQAEIAREVHDVVGHE